VPKFWQPTLFYKPKRTKAITMFTAGKRATPIRHVKRHGGNVRQTSRKFTLFGDLFDVRRGVAKRRGLL